MNLMNYAQKEKQANSYKQRNKMVVNRGQKEEITKNVTHVNFYYIHIILITRKLIDCIGNKKSISRDEKDISSD